MFKTGKHLTRAEKRAIQRRRANLLGVVVILALVATGVVLRAGWPL